MRILVITLYCGENEFEASVASVRRQTLAPAEHLIFENLPKREAHEKLYGTFVARRDEFDLMVKVDADLVLARDDLFERIAERFERDSAMQMLGIAVHDFFTDRRIWGLNSYRNTIEWSAGGDRVFTDRVALDKRAYRRDRRELAPAAEHSPDPSPYQAFHFGVHRGVKAAVARRRGMYEGMYMRCREVEWTWRHFLRRGDRRLGLAALGGELGMQGRFDDTELDYGNAHVRERFEALRDDDAAALERRVRRLRSENFGRLPWLWRMELNRGVTATLPLRWLVPLPARKVLSSAIRVDLL